MPLTARVAAAAVALGRALRQLKAAKGDRLAGAPATRAIGALRCDAGEEASKELRVLCRPDGLSP